MANEYAVNAADLTSVADAIRTKGGTSAQLAFPSGFVSAIGALGGAKVKTASGSFKTNSSGTATVSNLSFKPDLVFLSVKDSQNYFSCSAGFAFTAAGATELSNLIPPSTFGTYVFSACTLKQASNGFSATVTRANSSFAFSNDTNRSISYTAIKYTE